jgi:hypothetical protein
MRALWDDLTVDFRAARQVLDVRQANVVTNDGLSPLNQFSFLAEGGALSLHLPPSVIAITRRVPLRREAPRLATANGLQQRVTSNL